MSRKLTQLPDFSYTSLDFDSILEDTRQLIKTHPEYSDSWDDFLSSNSGMMLLELFSFVVEKYCSRVDWISKQLFLSTATDRQAVINILKLINHRPKLPTAAKINASLKLTKWIQPFNLYKETLYAANLDGTMSAFQLIEKAQDGKPDYEYQHLINTGTETEPILEFFNIPFYHGSIVTEDDIYMEGLNNEYFILQSTPVIENSIRIYSISRGGVELPQVESYISPEAQQNNLLDSEKLPPYTIEIDSNNAVKVKFGSNSLVKICNKNERLKVVYMIGGGSVHNVVANAVTMTKTITDSSGRRATAIFGNPNPAFGGAEEENLDDAKLIAPISLRSANKTVTIEDYISHLELSPIIMKANVIGKENEPPELKEDLGYNLPPLDTWIYVVPQKDNWEAVLPSNYNKYFKINRPYTHNTALDYEDISITQMNQSAYLKKYRNYIGYNIYVTLHDESPENIDWMYRDSYLKDTDYTFNEINGLFTRISTADGGNIPSGDRILRIRYVEKSLDDFKNSTALQFGSAGTILLDNSGPNKLCPSVPIIVQNIQGNIVYEENKDYEINFAANTIKLTSGSRIGPLSRVIVYYANQWMTGQYDTSEEKLILEVVKNKKMICVDNYVKDTVFSTFDIAANVTCSKNFIKSIKTNLEDYLRGLYSLNRASYAKAISKAEITKYIMKMDGVVDVEITYLGRNYEAYRRFLLNTLSREELYLQKAENVEYKLVTKYNEIFIPNDDEYEGYQSVENKRHGFIFSYNEVS